jgi:hypothetical protein
VTVRRGAVRTAAALLIGGASLGCSSGGDKAAPLPSITGTPTLSVPAFSKTREGAAAFVDNFYAVYNAALTDASKIPRYQALALSTCHSCANITGFLQRAHRNKSTVQGGRITVVSAVAPPFSGNSAVVSAVLDQAAGKVLDEQGKTIVAIPKVTRDEDEVHLAWQPRGWIVNEIRSFGSR